MYSWPPFERMGKSESSFHLSQWGLPLFVVQLTHPSTMKECSNSPGVVYKVPKGRFIICKKERLIAKRYISGTLKSGSLLGFRCVLYYAVIMLVAVAYHYLIIQNVVSLSLVSYRTIHSGKKCINKL